MADSSIWYDWENIQRADPKSYTAPRSPQGDLDKNAFLKLLITQLQYQDPLNPVDDKEFIAQMAQFTALEQMQNMNQRIAQTQAFGMIGKEVVAMKYNESTFIKEEISGFVTAVKVIKGQTFVILDDDTEVSVDDVQLVYNDGYINSIINLNKNTATSQAMALIGRTVQAIITDGKGKAVELIEGKVESVKFDGAGRPLLVIGTYEADTGNVISVGDSNRLIGKTIRADYWQDGIWASISGPIEKIIFTQEFAVKYDADGKRVDVMEDKVFAIINNRRFELKKIDLLSDAMAYIGQQIKHSGIDGTVKGIALRSAIPWLIIETTVDGETKDVMLSYPEYRGITFDDE